MRKIPTLFKRDPENMSRVLNEVNPAAAWVFERPDDVRPTRKYDGTCLWLDDERCWWARREVKPGKRPPENFLPVSTDEATGKTVGWEPIDQSPFVKFFHEVIDEYQPRRPGTYELVGPKINSNPEKTKIHTLWAHEDAEILRNVPLDFDGLRAWLEEFEGEGIVWHHRYDMRMAKLKRRDFGFR